MSRVLKFIFLGSSLLPTSAMVGCGTVVPEVGEVWEARDIDSAMAYHIKKKIFCELSKAIDDTNESNYQIASGGKIIPALPDNYGIQMQILLTIEENSSLNPAVTLNRTLPPGFSAGVTNIGQFYKIGFGAGASTSATRTDTSYSYFLVGKINNGKNKDFCQGGVQVNYNLSSPLIRSDLRIKDFLVSNTEAANVIPSSLRGKAKTAKLDVYSYEIKFVVGTSGRIDPTWSLVPVSGGSGLPFAGSGRTRTHNLILTFGPNAEDGFRPAVVSLNQHLAAQIKSATENLR